MQDGRDASPSLKESKTQHRPPREFETNDKATSCPPLGRFAGLGAAAELRA